MDSSDFFVPGAPTLAKLGAAALAEFAILPAAEFGLLLNDPERISIIGHSLGGLIGRSVALRYPRAIRHVITLGSPLMMSRGALPESVRITALHSRSDRIVRHPGALARDPGARNIEVRGSHVGLIVNPEVYCLLGALLSMPQIT